MDEKKMITAKKSQYLHGWDDEKIYFWDEKNNKEWCVSDELELYAKLVKLCEAYYRKKIGKKDSRRKG